MRKRRRKVLKHPKTPFPPPETSAIYLPPPPCLHGAILSQEKLTRYYFVYCDHYPPPRPPPRCLHIIWWIQHNNKNTSPIPVISKSVPMLFWQPVVLLGKGGVPFIMWPVRSREAGGWAQGRNIGLSIPYFTFYSSSKPFLTCIVNHSWVSDELLNTTERDNMCVWGRTFGLQWGEQIFFIEYPCIINDISPHIWSSSLLTRSIGAMFFNMSRWWD